MCDVELLWPPACYLAHTIDMKLQSCRRGELVDADEAEGEANGERGMWRMQ